MDSLGDRMKKYENCYRYTLPCRAYTLLRVDGKAFHTYTIGLKRPFDDGLIEDMNQTAAYLCKNIMGAKFAYVQSDEISILITDFDELGTQGWFGNNLQKMSSVASSMATARFNQLRLIRTANDTEQWVGNDPDRLVSATGLLHEDQIDSFQFAQFDARIWQIPQAAEVANYFQWRQQDATRNSISSVAQSLYSHKELEGVSSDAKQELIFQKGINWNDFDSGKKRGRIIEKITLVNGVDVREIPNQEIPLEAVTRTKWAVAECPVFSQDKTYLENRIPRF